jgi:hypothetical protein
VVTAVLEVVTVSDREQVQEILEELGADVDLESDARSGVDDLEGFDDSRLDGVDVSSTEVSVVKEYDPETSSESPGDYTREFLLDSGSRVTVTVKKRPECPNCGYIPLQDDEPVSLPGECTECGVKVCPQCQNSCAACGTILCSGCTMGHGSNNETYCPICRQDVQDEVEHHRELEKAEMRQSLEKMSHSQKMERLRFELEEWQKEKKQELEEVNEDHRRAMEMFEARLEEWEKKQELQRQLESDDHSRDMDKLDKMVKLAEMINSAEDTEDIRDRLTPSVEPDPFPEMGNQFSGMDLGGDSNTEEDSGYSYDEVFE